MKIQLIKYNLLNFLDVTKLVLKREFIASNTYSRREVRFKINILISHVR